MSNRTVLVFAWLFLSTHRLLGQATATGVPFQQNNSLNLAAGSGVSSFFISSRPANSSDL